MKYTLNMANKNIMQLGLVLLLLTMTMACQNESPDSELVGLLPGTWQQTSRSIGGVSAAKDSTRLVLQINENLICILCDSSSAAIKAKTVLKRSGWSYTGSRLNIAIDLPASWIVSVSADQLNLEKVDFNTEGQLVKTAIDFYRNDNLKLE